MLVKPSMTRQQCVLRLVPHTSYQRVGSRITRQRRAGPSKLDGPAGYFLRCYEPQIANAVMLTLPLPVKVTTAVPVQAVPPAFGAEDETAPLAPDPWVTVAPPPSNFVPGAQVAVDVPEVVPAAGFPPDEADAPVTTIVLATTPLVPGAPAGPCGPGTVESAPAGPAGPAGPVAPSSPFGPATVESAPAAPVSPCSPFSPAGPTGPAGPVSPV